MKSIDLKKLFIVVCCAFGAVMMCYFGATAEKVWQGSLMITLAVALCFIGFIVWFDEI
jgi:hypothetical protein